MGLVDYYLKFDEFFKKSAKRFFEFFNFNVTTEFELFNLPKKLDVLVVKNENIKEIKTNFSYFHYFAENNLISFKSPVDPTKQIDFSDALVYLNGFFGVEKKANYENITRSDRF